MTDGAPEVRETHAGLVVLVGERAYESTLAGNLADYLGAVLLSSDRVRNELAGLPPTTSVHAPYGGGITPPNTAAMAAGAQPWPDAIEVPTGTPEQTLANALAVVSDPLLAVDGLPSLEE